MNITCQCEVLEGQGLIVYYFTSTMTSLHSLCTTEVAIKDTINKKFSWFTIMVSKNLDPALVNEYNREVEALYSNPSYKDTVLMIRQGNQLLLFGLGSSAKSFKNQSEKLQQKYSMEPVAHGLENPQVGL